MVLQGQAKLVGKIAESIATTLLEVRPNPPGDRATVDPSAIQILEIIKAASLPHRDRIKGGVGDHGMSGEYRLQSGVQRGKRQRAADMIGTDAVEVDVERLELVLRVDKNDIACDLTIPVKYDDCELADAPLPAISGLNVRCCKLHSAIPQ